MNSGVSSHWGGVSSLWLVIIRPKNTFASPHFPELVAGVGETQDGLRFHMLFQVWLAVNWFILGLILSSPELTHPSHLACDLLLRPQAWPPFTATRPMVDFPGKKMLWK